MCFIVDQCDDQTQFYNEDQPLFSGQSSEKQRVESKFYSME